MTVGASTQLSQLENAIGFTLGAFTTERVAPTSLTPGQALESTLLRALQRPPCLISFSGGRDSTVLLALADDVARKHGLPRPIAATNRYADAPDTAEDEWQRLVLDHLRIEAHEVLDLTDELGLIGPHAQRFLRANGARWPANTHMHSPIVDLAAGGSVVTGFGGDEIGSSSQNAFLAQMLWRQRRPRRADLLMAGLAAMPRPIRLAVARRRAARSLTPVTWITAGARRRAVDAVARDTVAQPVRWDRLVVDYLARSRYLQLCLDSFDRLGRAQDVQIVHPFVEPESLAAFARTGGPAGLGTRADVLRLLAGDLVPADVLRRRTKARFDSPLWTSECTDFAQSWSGGGVDHDVVDPDRLRASWLDPHASVRNFGMLQLAWFHDHVRPAVRAS